MTHKSAVDLFKNVTKKNAERKKYSACPIKNECAEESKTTIKCVTALKLISCVAAMLIK